VRGYDERRLGKEEAMGGVTVVGVGEGGRGNKLGVIRRGRGSEN